MRASHFARALGAVLAASVATLSLGAQRPGAHPGESKPDFDKLQQSFAENHCKQKDVACSFEDVLARDFLRLELGVFDVSYPRASLSGTTNAQELIGLLVSLTDMQARLIAWMQLPPESAAAVTADIAVVRAWIQTLSPAELARAAQGNAPELLAATEATPEVCEASARISATLMDRDTFGIAPQYVPGVSIVMAPTRREFMEWLGFLGRDDAQWSAVHWVEGADQWTQFWTGSSLILCLEYAPWSGFDPQFKTGLAPSKIDPNGLTQHVLNQSARALFFRAFNRPELEHLERSLAANLVIEVAGSIVVLDGEGSIRTSGAQTAPYSRFVPGGMSEGGVLPPNSAAGLDSVVKCKWRAGQGTDFFASALREGQKAGAKLAAKDKKSAYRKDLLANFALDSDESGAKWVVHAPFLGPYASEQPYPATEFLNDYREFFKSYQTAFYHWLAYETVRDPGDGGVQASQFSDFLRAMGTPQSLEAPGPVIERVWGVPLSARDATTDSLEWRFLSWIAEHK